MLITVSGLAGSGKTTTAAGLADVLGYEHVSGGDLFRDLAAERGYSPVEFNERAEEDPQIDRDLDRRLYELARDRDALVLESRLAGWLAGDAADLRLWLTAPFAVRTRRIADREDKPVERASEETRRREDSEARRYSEYYDIDIGDLGIYDLVLNTARWSPDEVCDLLAGAARAYDPAADEGQLPVEGVRYDF
jgi:cytidylate kinase